MKKKELLSMPKLEVTEEILRLVREDKLQEKIVSYGYGPSRTYHIYERYQYYRACVKNQILKVAVFSRKLIAQGISEPEYEIYISKEENAHATYHPASEKWRKGKIDSLQYDIDDGHYYGNIPWFTEHTKKIVNEYLGTGQMGVKAAVLSFQNDVGKEKLQKKHRSEMEEIDEAMAAVPEYPKDFDDWILKSAFIHERFLMYRYGDKENKAYCTHCQQNVKLKQKPYHDKGSICPACRSKVILKAWKKQKYIVDEKYVGILQKMTDGSGYVLRRFRCKIRRTQEHDWKSEFAGAWEIQRIVFNEKFIVKNWYVFDEYKNTGIQRWCRGDSARKKGGYYYYYYTPEPNTDCILYYRNLKRLRKEFGLQYMPLEELWKHNQGTYCEVDRMIRGAIAQPKIEYLLKAGLYNLTWDILKGYRDESKRRLDWEQKKPWRFVGVTKEQLQLCIKMNITFRELMVLQNANELNIRLDPEQIRYFTKEIGPDVIGTLLQYGHPERFMKYLQGLQTEKIRLGDYVDYLNDVEKLEIVPTLDVLFPKNFQEMHERTSIQRQEKEDQIKKMEISEKDKLLQKMLPELKEIYEQQDEQFMMILPTCKEDFNREGRENHNCVGGTYFDKMLEGKCCVMFLRKKEEPDKAFCTVEMKRNEIIQCKAVRNSQAPKEAEEFMKRFSREVERRIQEKLKERMQAAVQV